MGRHTFTLGNVSVCLGGGGGAAFMRLVGCVWDMFGMCVVGCGMCEDVWWVGGDGAPPSGARGT